MPIARRCDTDPDKLAPSQPDNDQNVELDKADVGFNATLAHTKAARSSGARDIVLVQLWIEINIAAQPIRRQFFWWSRALLCRKCRKFLIPDGRVVDDADPRTPVYWFSVATTSRLIAQMNADP
jgi:hypothetical protein